MKTESYTPGHSQNVVNFMTQRRLSSHGEFVLPHLKAEMNVLDCGCGPGSITLDIARIVKPGKVVGIDASQSQVDLAQSKAQHQQMINIEFKQASVYELPFPENTFDVIFAHALLEHLSNPVQVLIEFQRVLKPTGLAAICSPDWQGFLLAPPSPEVQKAIETYKALQQANGGDVYVGRKFGEMMNKAGYKDIVLAARYECYKELEWIGEYLALQLEQAGHNHQASSLRDWYQAPVGMFAQSWVSCIGRVSKAS